MASWQSGSDGPFQASNLAKWFHSAPHKDLELDDATTIFSPGDESYREALYVLALCIFSFGALLFLLLVIYYTCCYCVCTKSRGRERESGCFSKSCLQLQVFILALICCVALIVGFVYNGKTSDGVDQFCNSVGDIQDDINFASKKGKNMANTLEDTERLIDVLVSETGSPNAREALDLTLSMRSTLNNINSLLPEQVTNESSDVGDKVHHYDNYRWLGTVILLAWCIFLCIFLFWTGCQVSGFVLAMQAEKYAWPRWELGTKPTPFVARSWIPAVVRTTIFCLITVLCTWAVTGADFGVATGIGDFCVDPKRAIEKIKKGNATSIVISYYMDCDGKYDPFKEDLDNVTKTLNNVITLIGKVPTRQPLNKEILRDLYQVRNNLPLYKNSFSCDKIHKSFRSVSSDLHPVLDPGNSLGIVMLSVFVIAVFSGVVTCCVCPLWRHRKPRPTTYNDVQTSPDDVGNAVLWWPHDVDAQSDRSFYERHGEPTERSPLIDNPPRAEPSGGNHANVNFIHVNYHGVPPPRREEVQSNIRHSF